MGEEEHLHSSARPCGVDQHARLVGRHSTLHTVGPRPESTLPRRQIAVKEVRCEHAH